MRGRLKFIWNRIRERLWVRPLVACLVSISVVILSRMADWTTLDEFLPTISLDSPEALLEIMASSMLVIATFSVASMLAAYSSAANTATPRSFTLVIADDVSQNALSAFVGAFIFSIVALVGLMNGYYGTAGRFLIFSLTLVVFSAVIFMFVRWVDRIARLGRLGETITKVEEVTARAIRHRQCEPTLRGVPVSAKLTGGRPIHVRTIGYVQRVDVAALQAYAEKSGLHICVAALPGLFVTPDRPLAHVTTDTVAAEEFDPAPIQRAFVIGNNRLFDEDPRFGLIVLSEIASRALSPAVNDPGTAIGILGVMVRLLSTWATPVDQDDLETCVYDRIAVPELSIRDLYNDAFTGIARDGAATVEVGIRLQKALTALGSLGHDAMREASLQHSRLALARAEQVLRIPDDIQVLREIAMATEPD